MKSIRLGLFSTLLLSALCLAGCKCKTAQNAENVATAAPQTEQMKKVIRAKISIDPEKVDAFIEATKSLVELSRAEEGNISYTLYQDPSDKTQFIFFEEWKDQAAIDFHFNTDHFKSFNTTVGEYAAAPAVVNIYDVISER